MDNQETIAVIGTGTIGLSFVALHLTRKSNTIRIFDTRPDLQKYIETHLPKYAADANVDNPMDRVLVTASLQEAVNEATIVQEAGPENIEFKSALWPQVEAYASPDALFWSATSGISATRQGQNMKDPSRLIIAHPFNPPHVLPIIEIVPGASTSEDTQERTISYFRSVGKRPVVLKKECTGFVANRLAFALFREACHLVNEGIANVEDVDAAVETSMGPRWAIAGPFKSYHAGGGVGGLKAFMGNIGGTVQACWEEQGRPNAASGEEWEARICEETMKAYGQVDAAKTARITKRILQVLEEEKAKD